MLDLRRIQNEKEHVTELLAKKGFKADFDTILQLDAKRKSVISEVEQLKAERKATNKTVRALEKKIKQIESTKSKIRKTMQ